MAQYFDRHCSCYSLRGVWTSRQLEEMVDLAKLAHEKGRSRKLAYLLQMHQCVEARFFLVEDIPETSVEHPEEELLELLGPAKACTLTGLPSRVPDCVYLS
jgi:hypothetical protein